MQRSGFALVLSLQLGNGLDLGGALKEIPSALCKDEGAPGGSTPYARAMALDRATLDRAAEALFDFVFSSCVGQRRWTDCDENTQDGLRGEALAVIEAVSATRCLRQKQAPPSASKDPGCRGIVAGYQLTMPFAS